MNELKLPNPTSKFEMSVKLEVNSFIAVGSVKSAILVIISFAIVTCCGKTT